MLLSEWEGNPNVFQGWSKQLASSSLLLSHSFFRGTTLAYLEKMFVSGLPLISCKYMEAVPPGSQFIQWFSHF